MLLHNDAPAAVESRDRDYVLGTYARTPLHPRSGKGAQLFDASGKVYWDLLAGIGVNALGHRHPRIMKTLRDSANELLHVSNLYYHPAQGLLAERLVRISLMSRVFFCNSGTEANEAALKLARLANPGRTEVVALEESFHGRTFGSLSLTGHQPYRQPFEPLLPDVRFVRPNDLAQLEQSVGSNTSAIFLEPILGEGGIVPLSDEFLVAARRLADRTGAILVFDEVQCGLGRTGRMFAFQHSGVTPDALTLAKPLGGGLPLGAVLTGTALDQVVKPGQHGSTFGGNPIACRLGLAVLDAIEEEKLLPRIEQLGQWFGGELRALQSRVPAIADVRGSGLMWGIELDRPAAPVAQTLLQEGFITGTARERVLRLLPPYVVPKKALSQFLSVLERVVTSSADAAMPAA